MVPGPGLKKKKKQEPAEKLRRTKNGAGPAHACVEGARRPADQGNQRE